jgi:hypothetical protein
MPKLPFLDRRKHRLEKLANLVEAASDQTLADALHRLGPEEMAFVLKTLPMDRSNRILTGFSNDALKAALALSKADAAPSDRMIAKFTDELSEERVSGPVSDQGTGEVPIASPEGDLKTPISVRALDFAGKFLGKFADAEDGKPD